MSEFNEGDDVAIVSIYDESRALKVAKIIRTTKTLVVTDDNVKWFKTTGLRSPKSIHYRVKIVPATPQRVKIIQYNKMVKHLRSYIWWSTLTYDQVEAIYTALKKIEKENKNNETRNS